LCSLKNIKVVLDASNGAGYYIAPRVLRSLGAKVYTINARNDGDNINNQCGALNKILSWADGLMHFDSKIKEVADGKIKLEGSPYTPFPTEAQIAARKVTEQTAKEAKMQQKQETLNDILNKF